MDTFKEQELLKGAQAFEMEALTTIYDILSPAIFSFSNRLLGSVALSEECVAETFSRFLLALKKGHGPTSHLRAYLYRIAHNWITDYYRSYHPDEPGDDELELIEDDSDVQALAEHNLTREQISTVLLHLPEKQRQVILLRYLEGWEHTEIAASMDKSVNSIKVIQHRAVRALRQQLSKKEY